MKFKAALIFISLFLLTLVSVSAADGCLINTTCTYWAYSSGADVTSVKLSIIDPNGSLLVNNQDMTVVDSETFKYEYIHNSTGNIIAIASFYNVSTLITSVAESKEIYTNTATEELDMISQILQPFLIFAVGVLLLVMSSIGKSNASAFYGIASGVWFLASATALLFTGVTLTVVFFMMIGIVAIFISIGELRTNINEGD